MAPPIALTRRPPPTIGTPAAIGRPFRRLRSRALVKAGIGFPAEGAGPTRPLPATARTRLAALTPRWASRSWMALGVRAPTTFIRFRRNRRASVRLFCLTFLSVPASRNCDLLLTTRCMVSPMLKAVLVVLVLVPLLGPAQPAPCGALLVKIQSQAIAAKMAGNQEQVIRINRTAVPLVSDCD